MKKTNIKKNNSKLSLLIQLVLVVCAAILFIIGFFEEAFNDIAELILMVALCVTAYNNHIYFKRKYLTVVYLLAALGIAVTFIFNIKL